MRLQQGATLGRYEVLELIGVGGMGEVYRARDTNLQKTVAIKTVSAGFAEDPTALPRFALERRIGAGLEHPHICRVLDAGLESGVSYLAMEYLTGETLAARMARGPLPLNDALGYAIETAEALAYAHDHGVIHRDLKPSNIFITATGVKVLDFGLASLRGRAARSPLPGDTVPLAPVTGPLMGTAMYTAPERLRGEEADHRTDIFAFGAVLYELLTSRAAFERAGVDSLLAAVLSADPRPMALSGPRGADLEWLVRRCLAKQPDQRWHSMHDVAAMLKRIASGHGGAAPGASAPRRTTIAAVVLAVGVLAAVGAWAGRAAVTPAGTGTSSRLAFAIPPPDAAFFTPTEGSVQTPQLALSPDGAAIAFVATGREGVSQIWVRRLGAMDAQPVRGTEGATYPFWSPDATAIAFFAEGLLKRVEVAGGPARTLAEAPHGRGGSWSADGTILFAPSTTGIIRRVSAQGGAVADATRLADPRGETSHRWPQFLPGGRQFLFFARTPQEGIEGIYLGSLDSPQVTFVVHSRFGGAFAPPDRVLYISEGTLLAQRIDLAAGRAVGDPVAIAEDVAGSSNFYPAFAVSPAGVLAFARSGDLSELVWVDRSGRQLATAARGQFVDFRLSADARLLAVAEVDRESGLSDVFVLDLERGARTRLTSERATDASPMWSADGANILFRSNRDRVHDLYVGARAQSGGERLLFRSTMAKYPTSWSRDGGRLLFHARDNETQYDVWVAEVGPRTSARPVLASRFNEVQAQFSPDGTLMAYASDETSGFETYVQSADGTGPRWQVSTGGGMDPRWAPDGRTLFFVSPDGWLMAADVASGSEPGVPRRLFQLRVRGSATAPYSSLYDVAVDGRFLLRVPVDDVGSNPVTVLVNWSTSQAPASASLR